MVTNRVSIRVSQELLEDSANGGVDVVEQIALSGAMALAEQELNVFFNALGINGTTRLTTSMGIKAWNTADAARRITLGTSAVTVPNQITAITALGSQYSENATLLISPRLFSNFSGISANTIQRELTWFGTPTIFTSRFSTAYTAATMHALYGDFRYFVVADHVSGLMINRYDEIAAGTGQVVFTISKRFGGGITNDLAFRSIVL
jgi:HK97 family phage major capsid protein